MGIEIHLSRLYFEGKNLRDAYDVHKLLWKAWPNQPDEQKDQRENNTPRLFLFRTERIVQETGVCLKVLVQSRVDTPPDWTQLPARLLQPAEMRTLQYSFHLGEIYRFYLRANPTMRRRDAKQSLGKHAVGDKKTFGDLSAEDKWGIRGIRVGLSRDEDLEDWLKRKLTLSGAELVSKEVSFDSELFAVGKEEILPKPTEYSVFQLRSSNKKNWHWSKGKTHATHAGVDFEGFLRVGTEEAQNHVAALEQAVLRGIGSGKGQGFGLLSLKRLEKTL